jgi:catechol 2,3-dioxygenase-like lactoylglutathione lyase family enzyme
MLGRFLELSLPAPRILESWQWYQRLGFVPATDGGVWSHRYAAVTDGRIAVGLHDAALGEPWLTWVRPGLAAQVAALEDGGIGFAHVALGEDSFNEARFATPDGQGVRLLEARTYSMPAELPPAALGWFEEIALPVRDLAAARDYWERIGFVTAAGGEEPWPWLALTSDTVNLALHATGTLEGPALVFSTEDRGPLLARLATAGIEPERRLPRALDPAHHLWLRSPEGTTLWIGPPPA